MLDRPVTAASAAGLRVLRNDSLLLLTAAIWGFAFVAQRAGMDHLGPFSYNGVRFALGALSLLPLIAVRRRRAGAARPARSRQAVAGLAAGVVLFGGASLQQIGIVTTSAGKAGFITGLYVILVPLVGLFWGQRTGPERWIGAVLAIAGLYFLSVTETFTMARGDFLVLLGALFWTAHVQVLAYFSPRVDAVELAAFQFAVCALLSLAAALVLEGPTVAAVLQAAAPIVYGGVFSVGVAYTLQVVAQKKAPPAHAAILLSLEGVFAALGGRVVLAENLSPRGLLGAALMLTGMIVSQIGLALGFRRRRPPAG